QALLLAEDVQVLEAPVDGNLVVDLFFLFRDARQLLARLRAFAACRGELLVGLLLLQLGPVDEGAARGQQRDEDRQRRGELFQFCGREIHFFRARPTVIEKRGASLVSAEPMSPDSVPADVTSKGSCVRRMRQAGSVRSASANRCTSPVMAR